MVITTGLLYPLALTQSGNVAMATSLDETMVQSWAQFIIDTEQPFRVFEASGSKDIAIGIERFRYSLISKCPFLFKIEHYFEANRLILNILWDDSRVTIPIVSVT